MSEPWPPAFMRTAPPIEPGTPTAHSKPVSPAATVWRATTGQGRRRPGPHDGAVDLDRRRRPRRARRRRRRSPRRPPAGSSPLPTTSTGTGSPATAAREPVAGRPRRSTLHEHRGRAADPVGGAAGRAARRGAATGPSRRATGRSSAGGRGPARRIGHELARSVPSGPCSSSGTRREVAGAEGQAEVAGAQLVGEERHQRRRGRAGTPAGGAGRASSTASTTQLAGDAGAGGLARRRRCR